MSKTKDSTTISIKIKEWERLNKLKKLGESMSDVVTKVLDDLEKSQK